MSHVIVLCIYMGRRTWAHGYLILSAISLSNGCTAQPVLSKSEGALHDWATVSVRQLGAVLAEALTESSKSASKVQCSPIQRPVVATAWKL